MSTVATKYFCQINKGSIFLNPPCSISFARAFSSKLLKSECQIRTPYSLTSFSSSNLVSKMSGEFSHKRYCHYKAAVLKKLDEKLEIVELKRSTKLKDTQVLHSV